mgnify:CR=1 FL=1
MQGDVSQVRCGAWSVVCTFGSPTSELRFPINFHIYLNLNLYLQFAVVVGWRASRRESDAGQQVGVLACNFYSYPIDIS